MSSDQQRKEFQSLPGVKTRTLRKDWRHLEPPNRGPGTGGGLPDIRVSDWGQGADFLTSGPWRDWGTGIKGGASVGSRREFRVLPGDKARGPPSVTSAHTPVCCRKPVIMSHAPKRRCCVLEEGSETQSVIAVVEEDTSSSSTCSSSFPSSSSSSSSYPLILSSPEEELNDPSQGPSQNPPSSLLSPTAVASPMSQSEDGSSSQKEESPSTSQALPDAESLPRNVIDDKVADLVEFLLLKYRTKELTTKAEMLNVVIKDYQDHFPEIFKEASECVQLAFGVDVKEVDPSNDSYALVTTLGLTCDGMMSDGETMPKNGILIVILSMIFMEGDCVSEEKVWEVLNVMGVYDGTDHFIYGEPRELITRVLVQEQYFEYRQVPNSDPPRYEFLWGPRAHAEICKMSLLEFLAKISGSDPRAFPLWYEEALRQQEERAQSGITTTDDTSAIASESSSAPSSSFCPE
ncbi:melanoma-associated antigen 10-like [Oryx dammah]|uniref:melanoma-associated antigen 10-like n=1 Tax=Oryx dammah TaxID=59534 RepID=UPI001A9B91B9|nr:melanoma-associated antigen 10-like [Oryx dammah]